MKYILGAAILLSAVYGVVRVYQSPFLTVNEVTVEGTSALDAEHVRAVSGITGSDTLLRLNPNEVEERLIDDPWILEAEVRRSLPGVVRISIVERVPVAVIDSGPDGYWLIDSAAVLLARQAVDETMTVPVVRDVALTEYVAGDLVDDEVVLNVLAVIDGLSPEMRSITRAISAPAIDRTALITQNDVEIFIGTADDLEMKDMLARRILDEQGAGVVSINVRSTDRPTWRGLDSTQ